ncbi:MAG: AI-2E family transporter, partial [Alphaproteobacteria bacterium]
MPNAESPGPSPTRHTQTAMLAERAAVLLLLALLLYGVIRVLEPFGLAIAFGAFIAIGTWPLRDAMVKRGIPRSIAATLMLLVLILSLAIPALALTPELGGQIAHASKVARDLLAGLPEAPPASLAGLPLVGGAISNWWPQLLHFQGDFSELLAPYAGRITSLLVDIGQAAAASVVQILLALIVATAFWINGDKLADEVNDIAARLGGDTGRNAVAAAEGAVRGVAWGIVGTGIIQAMLMGIGLAIAGVPGVGVISF